MYDQTMMVIAWAWAARARLLSGLGREGGQGIMEYAILLGAIALVAGAALYASNGFSFTEMRTTIQNCLNFSPSCG